MSAPLSQRYRVEFDPHAYIAEMRRVLCDPDIGIVTYRKRRDVHKENERAIIQLGHEIASSHRTELVALLRDLDIPRPRSVAPMVSTSFGRAAGNLSVVSDRYAQGLFSLAEYDHDWRGQILEALWEEFLDLGRCLPATLQLRKNLPILYLSADDYVALTAEYEGRVDRGVITRFVVNSPRNARLAVDEFADTMNSLTAEYGGRVDPNVIKHFAAHNPTHPRKAINQFLETVEALGAEFEGRVDLNVIKRCAVNYPPYTRQAIIQILKTRKMLTAEYGGQVGPSVIKYFAVRYPDPNDARKAIKASLQSPSRKQSPERDGAPNDQAVGPRELRGGRSPGVQLRSVPLEH